MGLCLGHRYKNYIFDSQYHYTHTLNISINKVLLIFKIKHKIIIEVIDFYFNVPI